MSLGHSTSSSAAAASGPETADSPPDAVHRPGGLAPRWGDEEPARPGAALPRRGADADWLQGSSASTWHEPGAAEESTPASSPAPSTVTPASPVEPSPRSASPVDMSPPSTPSDPPAAPADPEAALQALSAWESAADPVLTTTEYLADDLDDWLQGPLEARVEQDAEDAWSTADSVSRRQRPSARETAAPDSRDRRQLPPHTALVGALTAPAEPHEARAAGTRPVFRSELHGLRAVALTLVAVYHIWLGRVSGGVDVFLFLSAFFLTGTFVRRLESGRPLAVPRYWLHTFKRLLPPAAVTILATLVATWWLLPSSIWPTVMQQAAASIGYVQNALLVFQEVDYQARDAGTSSPLQHFWSLSVQGQAFLLWPLLFLLALPRARRSKPVRRPLLVLMALIVAASLTWSIIETRTNQPVAYFDTGARLWEFAAGSMLALALPWIDSRTGARRPEDSTEPRFGTQRAVLGWTGLIALLACGILLNVSSVFPGWIAIWPLAAAAAVVVAGHTGTRWGVDRLLSTRPAAFVGDISYALYLVHWPLLVLWLHHSEQERAGLLDGLVVLLASGVLAWLLTRLVDAPIRRSAWLEARPWRALTAVAASIALVLGAAGGWWTSLISGPDREGAVVAVSDGGGLDPSDQGGATVAEEPQPPPVEPVTYIPEGWQLGNQWPGLPHKCAGDWEPASPMRGTACETSLPADAEPDGVIAVVGSSHARQLIPAMLAWAQENNWQIVNLHRNQCLFETKLDEDDFCAGYGEWALKWIRSHDVDLVVTNSSFARPVTGEEEPDDPREMLPKGTPRAVQRVLDEGIDVLAVRDNPRWAEDQYACAEKIITGGGTAEDADEACGADLVDKLDAEDPGAGLEERTGARGATVHRLDLTEVICPEGRCRPINGNMYIYLDDNHLSRVYVKTVLAPPMQRELERILG